MLTSTSLVRVQLVREATLAYEAVINDSQSLANAVRELIGQSDREHFVALHLDSKHRIASIEVIATGTLNAVIVHPREVFKGAILANAHAIAVAHNHPSGDLTPSPEDRTITKQLIEAGEVMGIKLLDHIIVNTALHTSLRTLYPTMGWQP